MPQNKPKYSDIDRLVAEYSDQRLDQEADRQGVPRDFVRKIAGAESAGRPDVINGMTRSRTGAIGKMQLMPGTAKDLGVDPEDIDGNIRGGVSYAGKMLKEFGGDLTKAAAAYNAGPGAVRKYGGVPPYAETQAYVQKVATPAAPESDIDKLIKEFQQGQQAPAPDAAPIVPAKPLARPAKPVMRNPQRGPIVTPEQRQAQDAAANPFSFTQPTLAQGQAQAINARTRQISPDVAARADAAGRELGQYQQKGTLGKIGYDLKTGYRSAANTLADQVYNLGEVATGVMTNDLRPLKEQAEGAGRGLLKVASGLTPGGGAMRARQDQAIAALQQRQQARRANDPYWAGSRETQQNVEARKAVNPSLPAQTVRGGAEAAIGTLPIIAASAAGGGLPAVMGITAAQQDYTRPDDAAANLAGAYLSTKAGQAISPAAGALAQRFGGPAKLPTVPQEAIRRGIEGVAGGLTNTAQYAGTQLATGRPIDTQEAITQGITGAGMGMAMAPGRREAANRLSIDATQAERSGSMNLRPTPSVDAIPQAEGPATYSTRPGQQRQTQVTKIPTGDEYRRVSASPDDVRAPAAPTTEAPAQAIPAGNIAGIRIIAENERIPASQRRNVKTIVVKQPDGSMQSVRAMLPEGMTPGQARQVLQGAQKAQAKAAPAAATAQPTTEPLTPEAPAQVNPRQAARNENIQKAHEDSIAARTQAETLMREGRHDEAIRALTVEAEALRALRKQIPDRSRGGRVRRVEAGERLTQIQSEIKAAKIAQRQAVKAADAPTADLTGPLVADAPQTARMPEAPNRTTADLPRPMPRTTAEIPRAVDAAMTEPTNRLRNADYPGGEVPRTAGLRPEGQLVEIPAERVQENTNRLPGADYAGGEVRTYQQPQAEGQPVDVSRRPPAPPRPLGPRSVKSGPQGQYGPTTMSAAFPRSRRGLVVEGRRVQGEIEAGRGDKGEYGKLAQSMFKSTRGDVLHGQDSFFHDADVKGALGLTRDAEQGEVRAALKTELARVMGVKSEEVSLTQVPPQAWQNWAGMKQLGEGARAKLQVAIQKYQSPILDELQKTVNPPDSSPPRPIPTDAGSPPKAPSDYQRLRDANAKAITALNSVSAADAATPGGKRKFDAAADRLRKSAKQMGIDPSHADAIITDAMNAQMEAARRADEAPRPVESTPAQDAPAPKASDAPPAAETRPRAVSEAEAAPIAAGDAPAFTTWRTQGTTIRHARPGQRLSAANAASVIDALRRFNLKGSFDAEKGVVRIAPRAGAVRDFRDDIHRAWNQYGSQSERNRKADEIRQSIAQDKENRQSARKQEIEGKSDVVRWIKDHFGEDAFGDYNTLAMARFLSGETAKYEGALTAQSVEGFKKAGAVVDTERGPQADFEQLRRFYSESQSKTDAPATNTPAPKAKRTRKATLAPEAATSAAQPETLRNPRAAVERAGDAKGTPRKETYWNGDRAEYTGDVTPEGLHVLRLLEGRSKGELAYTSQSPEGKNPNVDRFKEQWRKEQEGFSRLHDIAAKKATAKKQPVVSSTPEGKSNEKNAKVQKQEAEAGGRGPIHEPVKASGRVARGTESTLKIPRTGQEYRVRYEVRELSDIQPSHNPHTFEKNPDYRLVNDRDYTAAANRMDVEDATKAGVFDPRIVLSDDPTATNGPPVIYEGGDVLGGNSRAMMIARVYRNHPVDGQKYRQALDARAEMYGLDKKQLARMDQPVLVRVIDSQPEQLQKLITDLNIQPGKAMSSTEAATARAKSMPPETMKFISDRLNSEGPDATLAMALEGDNGVAVLNRLIDDDVIPRGDRNRYLTDAGKLSVEAKSEIETMLLSRVFRDADQMKRAAPEMKNKLVRVAPHVAKLAGTDWDIAKYIPNAIQAAAESKAQKIDLEMLNRRGHLFGEGLEYKPEELAIARWIGELGPRQLENRFREYATAYDDFNRGQSLFGAPPDARESFDTIFKPARTGKEGLSFGELDRDESNGPLFGSGFGALQGAFKSKPPSGADLDAWMDRMGNAIPETMTDAQISRFDDLVNRAADAAEAGNTREWRRLSRQAEQMIFTRKDRAIAEVSGAMNATRSLMASGDLSAPLRQGAILTLPPSQWGKVGRAAKRMFQALSAGKYERLKQEIQVHPDFDAAEDAGLYLATNDSGRTRGEEDFLRNNSLASRITERLPILAHSERAYKMYLDSLRMDTFAKYKQVIEKGGGTVEQKEKAIKAAAEWINVATGRGSLGKKFDESVPLLSTIFFAPRYTASRIQVLNPATYAKNLGNPANRQVFRRQMSELFQSAAVLTTTAALAKYGLGATVNLDDPESPDWLKIKIGDTRYDVGAGLQQIARLGARIGKYMDTSVRGTEKEQGAASDKMVRAVKTFGRSKLGPVPSFFVDWLNNWTNVIGERHTPGEASTKNPIVSRITPLLWADMVDAYREGGAGKAARFTPGVFGVGVQDYDVNKKRKAGSKVRVRPKAPPMPGPPKGFGEL